MLWWCTCNEWGEVRSGTTDQGRAKSLYTHFYSHSLIFGSQWCNQSLKMDVKCIRHYIWNCQVYQLIFKELKKECDVDILFYRQCTYKTSHTFSSIALEPICTVKRRVLSVTDSIHVKAKCDAHTVMSSVTKLAKTHHNLKFFAHLHHILQNNIYLPFDRWTAGRYKCSLPRGQGAIGSDHAHMLANKITRKLRWPFDWTNFVRIMWPKWKQSDMFKIRLQNWNPQMSLTLSPDV